MTADAEAGQLFHVKTDISAMSIAPDVETDAAIRGAVFHMALGRAAQARAAIDPRLGRWAPVDAALVALWGIKLSLQESL